ncbi:MAG: DUF4982 domain-containing protein, partial [Lachnospiraceae bacterium]|nr:DUF4982 domain-containing protein [Lachnospiraceae bacterium]
EQRYLVEGIHSWDIDSPVLYTLKTSLQTDDAEPDTEETRVGFRTVTMDPQGGFFLNGRHLKLNGVCEHHDLGALGAAFNRTAFARKLKTLGRMGVNAIRFSHNMAAEEALNLADEMGFLVISEAFDMWERSKTEYDYARFFRKWHARDVERWIRRDRNHPCVILWSIGNEIYDTHADLRGVSITRTLCKLTREYDPMGNARSTSGSNYMPWQGAQNCAEYLDAVGYNYAEKYYQAHHEAHPDWVIYGSETASIVQSRGVYHFPLRVGSLAEEDEQCSALGNSCTSWGAHSFEECAAYDRDLPYSLGQFLWSGFDYIGEPTPYHTKNSYFGQIDTAGFPKDMYYFWAGVWTDPKTDPMVHIIPSYWDFNEGQIIDVRVVSNLDHVELFVNERSLGEKTLTHVPGSGMTLFADYQIPYEPGVLKAVAYESHAGEMIEAARDLLMSFGDTDAYTIEMEPCGEEDDLLFFDIGAVDEGRIPVGNASDLVEITVQGPGRLIGTDNGDSTDTDSYQASKRRLFNGKLLAIVRPDPGADKKKIQVTVQQALDVVPVRRLEILPEEGQLFTGEKRTIRAKILIHPADATDQEIECHLVGDTGVITNLAVVDSLEKTGEGEYTVMMSAIGDGALRLRAISRSSTENPRVLSELEYRVEGVGCAYLDPYSFVSGSLFTSSIGEVGLGNEKGVTSARDEATVITWSGLDFGTDFADAVTLPIFTLNDDPYMIQIWRGIPGEEGAALLADGVYQKPSIWNVYQEETWELSERLTGIQTISIRVDKKFHIKGFVFRRIARAFTEIPVTGADSIYGDQYEKREDAVYNIGNNVTIDFGEIDFGNTGADAVILTGRGGQANSVHLCLKDEDGTEVRQLIEFPVSPDFTAKRFALDELPGGRITGKKKVGFVFLPGTVFDFRSFRFSGDV